MQKIILSLFCPVLIAIVVRIILFVIGFVLALGGYVMDASHNGDYMKFTESIAMFKTFVWDESWCFWVIVAILTFFGEMIIWDENN